MVVYVFVSLHISAYTYTFMYAGNGLFIQNLGSLRLCI